MKNTKVIGFVVPMAKEAANLVSRFSNRKIETISGRKIISGRLGKHYCVICLSGTGKIRSAAGTQLLLDHFRCRIVLHLGSAGALSPKLKIGDFVLAKDV